MLRLAIDFGTSVTKIYKIGSGIVLAEPTCVTVQKETGEIRAFGSEAAPRQDGGAYRRLLPRL